MEWNGWKWMWAVEGEDGEVRKVHRRRVYGKYRLEGMKMGS